MKRSLFALLATLAVALSGVAAGRASADTSYVRLGEVPRPNTAAFPTLIDEAAFEDLAAITERLDAHLSLDANGLVQLDADVSAEELGVDEVFLANYRAALAHSNALIERGELTVDADLTVRAGSSFAALPSSGTLPGPLPGAKLDGAAAVDGAVPDAAVPQWGAYGYGSGAMFFNSYNTFYQYRFRYYGLSSAMAAYLGYPHMSSSLNYFYTYNNQYLSNSCYNPYGVYYFLPYQTGCQFYNSGVRSYQPCYGNLGYKPAYYWQQTNTYSSSCRCYQSNWQWQGYWSRY